METQTHILNFLSLREHDQLDVQPLQKDLILTSKKEILTSKLFMKVICGAMNAPKGAYILIGVSKLYLRVVGESFNDADLQHLQSLLKKVESSLQPSVEEGEVQLKIFPVLREQNNLNGEQLRFLICIEVSPKNNKKTYYYRSKKDKFYIKEFFYVLEKNDLVLKEREDIYHLILNKFNRPPHLQKNIVRTSHLPEEHILEKENLLEIPSFKYHYNTIITLPKKKKFLIDHLFEKMKSEKFQFTALKPFESVFHNEFKEIWFVTSDRLYDKQLKKINSSFFVNFFSIRRTIKIITLNKGKIGECKREVKKAFKLSENDFCEQVSQDNYDYLVFKELLHALFGFLFFEFNSVRACFCKKFV